MCTCTLCKRTNIKSTKEGCGSSQILFLCPVLISGCNEREGGQSAHCQQVMLVFHSHKMKLLERCLCQHCYKHKTNSFSHLFTLSLSLSLSLSLLSLSHSPAGKRADQEWPNSTWAPGEEAAHSDQQNGKTSWDHGKINAQQYAHIFTLFEYAWYIVHVCAQVSWSLLSYS